MKLQKPLNILYVVDMNNVARVALRYNCSMTNSLLTTQSQLSFERDILAFFS